MTDPINNLARPQASSAPTEEPQELGRDAFMRLLVAQLENQDPLEPMDAQETVTQLAELTSVEHLMGIESRIGALEIATAGMANTQVASLLGRDVVASGGNLRLDSQGTATGAYGLDAAADEVTVTIRNDAGDVVQTVELGGRAMGPHTFEWDGTDGSGGRAPAGRYTMEVTARGPDGNPIVVSDEVRGRVDGVTYENGFPELRVGGRNILLGDIRSVS